MSSSFATGKDSIASGSEVVLSGRSPSLSRQPAAVHRRMRNIPVPNGEEAVVSEVSFTSAVRYSKILGCVAQSTDREHRAMFNDLVKMAACLHVVGAGRGRYIGR